MARKTIEFLFDFGSPASYLAYKALAGVAERTGATVEHRPVLLGGVFKATGNASPATVPAKGAWMNADLARWAVRRGTVFNRNPHFPINTLHLMRGAAGLKDDPRFAAYVDAVFDAMWMAPKNLGDPAEMGPVLARAGVSAEEFMGFQTDEAVKARLKADTEDAVARGMFGAPTFFVDGQMFFGQDRLDFVEEAARSAAA